MFVWIPLVYLYLNLLDIFTFYEHVHPNMPRTFPECVELIHATHRCGVGLATATVAEV